MVLLGGLVIAAPLSYAQATKVKEFDLDPHRDRRVLFDLAVTPRKEVLSFVAKDTGNWQLYRTSNWLSQNPTIDKLSIPGFFSKQDYRRGGKSMETMDAQVFATRDCKYAVCAGSAMWLKRVAGRAVGQSTADEVIVVVDLSNLKIVATANTADLDLFGARGATLDDDGFLRIDSLSTGKVRQGAFIRFSIPSLKPGPKCSYDWIVDGPGREHPEATTTKKCTEIIGSRSLADYLSEGQRQYPAIQQVRRPRTEGSKVCENNQSEFCRWPGEFTADGQFGVALRTEGHDNFWGSWVVTNNSYIIFSMSRKVDIGEIREPTNDSFQSALTYIDGHDYLVVLQSGTHLTAYELRNQSN
jgi:hypothetical protein